MTKSKSIFTLSLLLLAVAALAPVVLGDIVIPGHIYQQCYYNGSASGNRVEKNESYKVYTTPSSVGYAWTKTDVVKKQLDDIGYLEIETIETKTYTDVPYSVDKIQKVNTYENIYFTGNAITVSYDGNGATGGSTASSSFTYDVSGTIAANGFTRAFTVTYNPNGGSVTPTSDKAESGFLNWANTASGTATYTYASGQTGVSNPCGSTGGAVTLYARWQDALVSLPTPTRSGYTFDGWYTAQTGGTRVGGGGDSYTPSKNTTLYAQWTLNQYDLELIVGTGVARIGYKINGSSDFEYTSESKTVKVDYDTTWYARAEAAEHYTTDESITQRKMTEKGDSYAPTATPDKFTISKQVAPSAGGEIIVDPIKSGFEYGEKVTLSAYPASNYAFQKWRIDGQDRTGTPLEITITNDVYCTAYFGLIEPCEITVAADPSAGGSVTGGGQHNKGASITLTATPNAGYSFEKWTDDATQPASRQITVTGDATYTACFTGNVYQVKFVNAYSEEEEEVKKQYVQHGSAFGTLPVPKTAPEPDQTFIGWFDDDGTEEQITEDTIVTVTEKGYSYYAHWAKPAYHYVRFDGNGATNKEEMAVQPFAIGQSQALAANEYGTNGCSFAGWATNESEAVAGRYTYTDGQIVSFPGAKENETNVLYATWAKNSYPLEIRRGKGIDSVRYTIDGVTSDWFSTNATVRVEIGKMWSATATVGEGYTENASCSSNGTMTADGAVFAPTGAPNKISVTYNPNCKEYSGEKMGASTFTYDQGQALSSNKFERVYEVKFDCDGGSPDYAPVTGEWAFVEWNANQAGTGLSYGDGEFVTNVNGVTGGSTTLYAQWKTNAASVIILPAAPSKEGNVFMGWYDPSAETKIHAAGSEFVPEKSVTLKAKWEIVHYDLNLIVNEGISNIWYATEKEKVGGTEIWAWSWHSTTNTVSVQGLKFGHEWAAYAEAKSGYSYTEYDSKENRYEGAISADASKNIFSPVAVKIEEGKLSLTIGAGIAKICYAIGEAPLEWRETTISTGVVVACDVAWQAFAIAKTGYTTNATCAASGTMTKSGETFAPSATANKFSVGYDGNGATSGKMDAATYTYDETTNLTANAYARNYTVTFYATGCTVTNASGAVMTPAATNSIYKFDGWATNLEDAASRRVSYTDGQSVRNLSTGDAVTLYAVWMTNESSVVTLPGATREDYAFAGWKDAVSQRVYEAGATLIPTNAMTFVAQWQIVLSDLSRAVGLTNAVLKATADEENGLSWAVRSREATSEKGWDWGHETYIRLLTTGVTVDSQSPLKLYVSLNGSGKFSYQVYWKNSNSQAKTKPTLKLLDIAGGTVKTNLVADSSTIIKWEDNEVELSVGSHELRWIVEGDLSANNTFALDNMSWTPDEEPEPEPTPVVPGGEMPTYGTEDDAKAAAQSAVVVRPNAEVESVVSAGAYSAMFDVKPVPTGVGDAWTLAIQLKESVSNEVQTVLDAAETNLCSVITNNPISVTFVMKPGLYYGLAGADVLADLPEAVVPADKWVLGGGGETSVSAPRPSETNAFYQLRMAITRPE